MKIQKQPIQKNAYSLLLPSYSPSHTSYPSMSLSVLIYFSFSLYSWHPFCHPPLLLLNLILLRSPIFLLFLHSLFLTPLSARASQASPLVVSSHPTINSQLHSQEYDKVIMHGPCAAPAPDQDSLTHTHTHTHTQPAPLVLMEVDNAYPLKILWMSSIRESWQPAAPPINLSLHF